MTVLFVKRNVMLYILDLINLSILINHSLLQFGGLVRYGFQAFNSIRHSILLVIGFAGLDAYVPSYSNAKFEIDILFIEYR